MEAWVQVSGAVGARGVRVVGLKEGGRAGRVLEGHVWLVRGWCVVGAGFI